MFIKLSYYRNSKLTLGSNFKVVAVKNAALPSFNTIENPPTSGEYSISIIYVFSSTMGIATTIGQYRNIKHISQTANL